MRCHPIYTLFLLGFDVILLDHESIKYFLRWQEKRVAKMKTGTANLPLHGGSAPSWLFKRMCRLAGEIVDVLVYEHGQEEFLRRISDPYWFQAFSCVLGFDWHSSGTTTVTTGALKMAVTPERHGIAVQRRRLTFKGYATLFLSRLIKWPIL